MKGTLARGFALLSASCVAPFLMLAASGAGVEASPASPARAMTLVPVDGGSNYYGQFTNPLPDDPSFFPISAWLRPANDSAQVAAYKDFGLNVMLGVENPEGAKEQLIRNAGLYVIMVGSEFSRFNDVGSETVGYHLIDEVDMCCGPPDFLGGNGYRMLTNLRDSLPADRKIIYNNYGQGVLFWQSDADAARFVNDFQDIVAADYYYFTLPRAERLAANYGKVVDRIRYLDGFDGKRQPVWNNVELGWPFTESASQGGRRILPDELRAAVWHSIIAGARGINYFDHNFGPGTPGSTIRGKGYADNRAMARATNRRITDLAPVLNSPTVSTGWSAGPGTTAMVKWVKSKKRTKKAKQLYVFAGSAGSSVHGSFSLPCVRDTKATVVGEGRNIPIHKGSFSDRFADGNAIHIYRINRGSRCGPRKGKVSNFGLPGGGDPPTSSSTDFGVIIAAVVLSLAGMLAFFRVRTRPERESLRSRGGRSEPTVPRSGDRATRRGGFRIGWRRRNTGL